MKTTINTLDQLAEVINANEDFPVDTVTEAIERNGWKDGESVWDICSSDTEKLTFDDDGMAVVIPLEKFYKIKMTWDNPYLRNYNGGDRDIFIYLSYDEAKKKMLDLFNELFIGQINLDGGFAKNWNEAMASLGEMADGASDDYVIYYDSRRYTIEEMDEDDV